MTDQQARREEEASPFLRPRLKLIPLLLVVGLLVAEASPSQAPPSTPAQAFQERVAVQYVLVPVAVRSRSGFVTDLTAESFSLFVDDEPVEIESFDRGFDLPISLVFLQDLSGSMAIGDKLAESRRVVSCFLDRSRAGDRHAMASFAGRKMAVDVPFTGDLAPLREAMAGWKAYGVTALHDAVAQVPEITVEGRRGRAAILLITDGAENASEIDPAAAREVVRKSSLPVYVMSFLALGSRRPKSDTDGKIFGYRELLLELASSTGGRYVDVGEATEPEALCADILLELRSRYVLGFPTGSLGTERYHEFRLEVDRRGVSYTHRKGYTGPAPSPANSVR